MVKRYTYGHDFTLEEARNLVQAFLHIANERECQLFLSDLLTPQEVEDLSRRLEAARLLSEGTAFDEVCKRMKMGSQTLTRIYRGWKKGQGYKTILKKIKS